MQLIILPIALVLAVSACFAGLFWSLRSRFDPQQCGADWLDSFSLWKLRSHGTACWKRRCRVPSIAAGISSGNRAPPDGGETQDFRRLSGASSAGLQSTGRYWQTHDGLFHAGPGGICAPVVRRATAFLRRGLFRAAPTRSPSAGLGRSGRPSPGGGAVRPCAVRCFCSQVRPEVS